MKEVVLLAAHLVETVTSNWSCLALLRAGSALGYFDTQSLVAAYTTFCQNPVWWNDPSEKYRVQRVRALKDFAETFK